MTFQAKPLRQRRELVEGRLIGRERRTRTIKDILLRLVQFIAN
ncbi:hypothetical protein [Rhodoblastus sp.]|nr:hypothetical protein [Rhodoblastus sp.]